MLPTKLAQEIQYVRQLILSGDNDQALGIVERLINISPNSGVLWRLKGLALFETRQFHKAMQAFEQATTLSPLCASSQFALAECYQKRGFVESAACIYQWLAARTEELPLKVLPQLAARLGSAGKFHLALQVCRRAARLQPECEKAAFGVAYYMGKAGCPPEQTLPAVQRAFSLAPNVFAYRVALAQLQHRCGNTMAAYQLLKNVEMDDIANIKCQRCIRQLWQVFEAAEDHRRSDWCRARLQSEDVS